ncbi:XRE family transcriptional regulator [Leptolyngbya valderiana BDU 20041]|nr:helix-turn-helix transcriptional regulator [Geitlerinema sp. CS-897]OAB62281.1 XRE family transcriptional regulator [Leptolyngbya valderiana BDU 20041]PPT10261.1 Transcriptional regulator XRE family [Geitlerinema sp. FC II]
MEESFGTVIRRARTDLGLSQRELAKMLRVDFTYLSKLENDRADYAAKEDVIRSIAQHLELDEESLVFLAGRTPQRYEQFLKKHHREMPKLFQRMAENPAFAEQVFRAASGEEKLR